MFANRAPKISDFLGFEFPSKPYSSLCLMQIASYINKLGWRTFLFLITRPIHFRVMYLTDTQRSQVGFPLKGIMSIFIRNATFLLNNRHTFCVFNFVLQQNEEMIAKTCLVRYVYHLLLQIWYWIKFIQISKPLVNMLLHKL